MNATFPTPSEPRDGASYMLDCVECGGAGEIWAGMRWAGGGGGEWLSERCPVCEGACSFRLCSGCDRDMEPGEVCSACDDPPGLPVVMSLGRKGVGL